MEEQDVINLINFILMLAVMGTAYYFGFMQGKHKYEYQRKIKIKDNQPTPKTHWNYRVATRMRNKDDSPIRTWREYLIISCYYTDGKPDGYGENTMMNGFEELHELNNANSLMATAFEKDILNLDEFPNIYIYDK